MTSFSCFCDLPIELRLKVWYFAVNSVPPRVITLYPDSRLQKQNPPLPSIARVCHEAREIFQRIYVLSLGSGKRYNELQAHLPTLPPAAKDIYVNFERDLIYLPCIRLPQLTLRLRATDDGKDLPWPVYNFPNVGILRARRLATKIYFEGESNWLTPPGAAPALNGLPGSAASVWKRLAEFSDLKELYLITGHRRQDNFVQAEGEDTPQYISMKVPAMAPLDYIETQSRPNLPAAPYDPVESMNVAYLEGLVLLWESWLEGHKGESWHTMDWKIVAERDLLPLFDSIIRE